MVALYFERLRLRFERITNTLFHICISFHVTDNNVASPTPTYGLFSAMKMGWHNIGLLSHMYIGIHSFVDGMVRAIRIKPHPIAIQPLHTIQYVSLFVIIQP